MTHIPSPQSAPQLMLANPNAGNLSLLSGNALSMLAPQMATLAAAQASSHASGGKCTFFVLEKLQK